MSADFKSSLDINTVYVVSVLNLDDTVDAYVFTDPVTCAEYADSFEDQFKDNSIKAIYVSEAGLNITERQEREFFTVH